MAEKKKNNRKKVPVVASKKQTKKTQPKDKSTKILLIIFLVLCVVVFVLATIMITENANSRKDKYDIRIPITEESLKDGIEVDINMDDVKKNQSKEYRMQLTNYINDTINDEVMKYQMKVSLPDKDSNIDIELYSSNENYELLEGKKKITGERLSKDKKEKITYTLKLTQRQAPKKNEYVKVEITKDE